MRPAKDGEIEVKAFRITMFLLYVGRVSSSNDGSGWWHHFYWMDWAGLFIHPYRGGSSWFWSPKQQEFKFDRYFFGSDWL